MDVDQALISSAAKGDREALEAVLREVQPYVYATARRLVNTDSDALDITQNALISIVRGIAKFRNDSRFKTWVFRIVHNAVIDEMRRASRRPVPVETDTEIAGSSNVDLQASTMVDVERALSTLQPEFRVAVVLRDVEQFSYEEIASLLNVPIGTVRSRIARGRSQLADSLSGNQMATRTVEGM